MCANRSNSKKRLFLDVVISSIVHRDIHHIGLVPIWPKEGAPLPCTCTWAETPANVTYGKRRNTCRALTALTDRQEQNHVVWEYYRLVLDSALTRLCIVCRILIKRAHSRYIILWTHSAFHRRPSLSRLRAWRFRIYVSQRDGNLPNIRQLDEMILPGVWCTKKRI